MFVGLAAAQLRQERRVRRRRLVVAALAILRDFSSAPRSIVRPANPVSHAPRQQDIQADGIETTPTEERSSRRESVFYNSFSCSHFAFSLYPCISLARVRVLRASGHGRANSQASLPGALTQQVRARSCFISAKPSARRLPSCGRALAAKPAVVATARQRSQVHCLTSLTAAATTMSTARQPPDDSCFVAPTTPSCCKTHRHTHCKCELAQIGQTADDKEARRASCERRN